MNTKVEKTKSDGDSFRSWINGWYRMQLSVNGAKFLPSFRLNIDKGSSWIQDLSYHTSNFMPKKKQVTLILSCVSVRLQV